MDGIEGTLKQFLIEPFVPHRQNEECYLCIYSHAESQDVVLFHHEGGVDVGNVDEKVYLHTVISVTRGGNRKSFSLTICILISWPVN